MNKNQSIRIDLPAILAFVLFFTISCICTLPKRDNLTEEFNRESNVIQVDSPITLKIKVEYIDYQYHLLDAEIIGETFVRGTHMKINGPYGIRGISDNGEALFNYVNFLKPINRWVSLPFSGDLAGIELFRNKGSKPILSYFSREQLIELADYIPLTELE